MKTKRKVDLFEGNGFPLIARKILPNELCACGSGKKAKKCCGFERKYFYSKLNESQKQKIEDVKEKEQAIL